MANNENLKPYYKYLVFIFLFGFGGTVWGAMTYFLGIPVALLDYLGASSTKIGAISAIFWGGFALPQIWAAFKSESLTIKKNFIGWSLLLSSLGFLVYGIFIVVTGLANQQLSVWLFLILYIWACFLAGLYIPPNFAMLFKIIPTERLGQLLGIMFSCQFGGLFVSGFAIGWINSQFPAPMNFAVLFIATFFFTIISAFLIFSINEPEGEPGEGSESFGAYMVKFIDVFKTDREFIKFLAGKWLMAGHYIMQAFLLAFLINERGYVREGSGWFSALNGLGLFIGGFTITKIADKWGPKYLLMTSQIIALVYTAIAWWVPDIGTTAIFASFVVTGLAQISDNVGYSNTCMLLCPTADKTTYVAATNVGIILPMVVLPIIMGKIMDLGIFDYNGTFTVAMIMMVAAILYIWAFVRNPQAYVDLKNAAAAGNP